MGEGEARGGEGEGGGVQVAAHQPSINHIKIASDQLNDRLRCHGPSITQSINQSTTTTPPPPSSNSPQHAFSHPPFNALQHFPPSFFFPTLSAATIFLCSHYIPSPNPSLSIYILPNRNERRDPARHAQRDKPIATCTSWAQHNMRR